VSHDDQHRIEAGFERATDRPPNERLAAQRGQELVLPESVLYSITRSKFEQFISNVYVEINYLKNFQIHFFFIYL
jgi:hypothetical protein